MPQKHNRTGKHVGHEDLAAMSIQEMLEHLKEHYGVTDLKPTFPITHMNRPPWTEPGDSYIRNALDCWNDCSDEWGANIVKDGRYFHASALIKRHDLIQLITEKADGDFPPTW